MFRHDWHQTETTVTPNHRVTLVRCLKCREEKTPTNLACKQQKGRARLNPHGFGTGKRHASPRALDAPHGFITTANTSTPFADEFRARAYRENTRTDAPTGIHAIAKRMNVSWRRVASALA